MISMENENRPILPKTISKFARKRKGRATWYKKNGSDKKQLNRLCNLTNKDPENEEIRRHFYNVKKEYKKTN